MLRSMYVLRLGLDIGVVTDLELRCKKPSVPFGGMKQSGWGRELGAAGLENYLTTKVGRFI